MSKLDFLNVEYEFHLDNKENYTPLKSHKGLCTFRDDSGDHDSGYKRKYWVLIVPPCCGILFFKLVIQKRQEQRHISRHNQRRPWIG